VLVTIPIAFCAIAAAEMVDIKDELICERKF
jgi:hypothetical protein